MSPSIKRKILVELQARHSGSDGFRAAGNLPCPRGATMFHRAPIRAALYPGLLAVFQVSRSV